MISVIRVLVQMISMRFVIDAGCCGIKAFRSFTCLFSSGQHGGQRKPADVIINGQLGGNKKRRKLLQKSYIMILHIYVFHLFMMMKAGFTGNECSALL